MNNQNKMTFFLRHTEGAARNDGVKAYEEDFYLNPQYSFSTPSGLHFFAYGECLWRSRFRQDQQYHRPYWSFELVTEGDGIFICNNIRYNLRPGELYIIRPDGNMSARPGPSGFLRKKCVSIESSLIDYICENLKTVNVVSPENPLRLESIYAKMKQLILAQEEFVQDELDIQAYALLVELNRLAMPIQYPLPLWQAKNLIKANLHRQHTLNSLSLECKVSVSTLSRLFQRHLNTSPMNYIIACRLEYTKQWLKVGNMSLKEIAERCGYKSESFLSRSFKKRFGMSPAAYRRS